jgi:hypothetical protein
MKVSFPHERLSQRWWREWWSEDFSWTGLASKAIGKQQAHFAHGGIGGEKTLQDYWRLDSSRRSRTDAELLQCGELVRDNTERLWHLCHVPLSWKDGSPAKAAWRESEREKVRALTEARLGATGASKFSPNGQTACSPDGRAQLQGVVFCEAPVLPGTGVLRICADFAWIPTWDAGASAFGASTSFRHALFDGHVRFHCATFEAALLLDYARFLGDVTVGSVPDSRAAQFSAEVSARGAVFLGPAQFARCGFSQGARFDGAHFAGEVEFFAATLDGAFDHATFDERVCFMSATMQSVSFSSVRCNAFVDFSSAKFSMLYFRNCEFRADVNFMDTKFPRSPAALVGGFAGARFHKAPDFQHAGFHWIAALDGVILDQGILLDKAGVPFLERQFNDKLLPAALKVPADYEENIPRERSRQLLALQGGCRTIRLQAERTGDTSIAQLYAGFEARINEQVSGLPVPADTDD